MSDPQIIRTVEELQALDRETMLVARPADEWDFIIPATAGEWLDDWKIDPSGIFPLAVIATGVQVRTARKALEES